MNDSIALLLKELRLPAFVRHYEPLWQTAVEKGWSHTDYLAALCDYEISDRYQRRTQRWIREAQLASGKTFTELEDSHLSRENKALLARLSQSLDWAHLACSTGTD